MLVDNQENKSRTFQIIKSAIYWSQMFAGFKVPKIVSHTFTGVFFVRRLEQLVVIN